MDNMNEQKDPLADLSVILYYINLDRDTARRDDMEQQAREQGVVLHRIPGVFGAALTPEDISAYDDKRRRKLSTVSLGKGELGCLLSHVKSSLSRMPSTQSFLRTTPSSSRDSQTSCAILSSTQAVGAMSNSTATRPKCMKQTSAPRTQR